MAHDVFISYSSKDKAVADAVCATIENRKIRCWMAPRDVLAGQPYGESILNGINKSRVFVLVFSSDSNISPQVLREVERAVHRGIPIVPFRIEDVEPTKSMELFLSSTHWLDALTPPLENHLRELTDTVETLLQAEASQAGETPRRKKTTRVRLMGKKTTAYTIAAAVLVIIVVVILALTGTFSGNNGGTVENPSSLISGNGSEIGSTTSPAGGNGTAVPGGTATSVPGSTSTIPPDGTPSSPLATATSVIDTSGQMRSGASTPGTLGKGETHFYYFNAESGDAIFFVLSKGTNDSGLYPWMELLGPDGKVLASNFGSKYTDITGSITATGKYTLRVRDYNNNGGEYVLSFMQLSQSVNPLNSGVSLLGKLQMPGDVNWYTFDAAAGDNVMAVLSEGAESGGLYPWMRLFGPDGATIASNFGSSYTNIDGALPAAGKYTLQVRDYNNNGGNYVLSFLQSSKSVNPLNSGVSLLGNLQVPGDINWYSFTASAGDAVFAVLSEGADSGGLYPWLELAGPDGKIIASKFGSAYTNIDLAITVSGKYIFRVRDYNNSGGGYVLSFMQLSKSVNPLTSGSSTKGELKVPGDINWYTFDAAEGDVVSIILSEGENAGSLYPWVRLLGPDGQEVASNFGSTYTNIDRTLPAAGKYTLQVRDYSNNGGNYVLSFNLMTQS